MPAGHAFVAQVRIVFAFAQRQAASGVDWQDASAQVTTHGGMVWQEPRTAAIMSAISAGANILRYGVKNHWAEGVYL